MQDSKFSCLVFVRVEKQRFGNANFSGGEMILIGQFFAVESPGSIRPPKRRPNVVSSVDYLMALAHSCHRNPSILFNLSDVSVPKPNG